MGGEHPDFMPWDNNLFADEIVGQQRNVACTMHLPETDDRKFLINTPSQKWRSMERTWQPAPGSERIVEDFFRCFESFKVARDSKGLFIDPQIRGGRRRDQLRHIKSQYLEEARKEFSQRVAPRSTQPIKRMADYNDLHPDAVACIEGMLKSLVANPHDDYRADGKDVHVLKTVVVLKPEDLLIAIDNFHLSEEKGKQ